MSQRTARLDLLFTQAKSLKDALEADIVAKNFAADDVRMLRYNTLVQDAANLVPEDPVLNGGMPLMPDADIQFFEQRRNPSGAALGERLTRRMLANTERLIDRVDQVLVTTRVAPRADVTVALQAASGEARTILGSLGQLRKVGSSAAHAGSETFDWVTDASMRSVLMRDSGEAESSYSVGAHKLAAICAGGIVEGMLAHAMIRTEVQALSGYASAIAKFPRVKSDNSVNWDRVGLNDLISAASALGLIGAGAARMASGLRDYRDTVHPQAEIRRGVRAELEDAEVAVALARLINRDLRRYFDPTGTAR